MTSASHAERAPGLGIVRAVRWLVPSDRRAEWEAEWRGEAEYYWAMAERRGDSRAVARVALLMRCAGAARDALWIRRHHGVAPMLGQDIRYAARTLARRPGFSATVVLTLALAIGANAAIFSVVNAVLLRQLPYPEPDRMVMLWGEPREPRFAEKVARWWSLPDFDDTRKAQASFESMTAIRSPDVTLTATDLAPSRVPAALVTSDFFRTLRTAPVLGRALGPADDAADAPRVAVISHALWQSRHAGSPTVLDASLVVDGVPHAIVGVMPAGFRVPEDAELWTPLPKGDQLDGLRGAHRFQVFGRLKDGVTLAQAEAEMRVVARGIEDKFADTNAGRSVKLEDVHDAMVGGVRQRLLVLFGAVALVLLVGCTNVASLFLARAAQREREVAVRAALGAGSGRLVRQFVTESMMLSLVGGLVGLLVAVVGVKLLLAAAPGVAGGTTIPRAGEVRVDLAVVGYLLAISTAVGLLFGVVPSLGLVRGHSARWLRDGTRGPAASRRRLRQALVSAEVALAVILVTGGALLAKSFSHLVRVDPGFEPERMLVAYVQLPDAQYRERAQARAFFERLRADLSTDPQAESVALAFEHPMSPGWTTSYSIPGREVPAGQEPEARMRPVSPGYFHTAGIPMLGGRDFAETDRADGPGVVIVNEAFARRHFPGESAVGKRIGRQPWWDGMPTSYEIIGVTKGERFLGLDQQADPATYFAFAHFPLNAMWVVVKTKGDPAAFASRLRAAVWRIDRNIPLDRLRTMDEMLGDTVAAPRFTSRLMQAFAAAALLLAALGIYGVLSYTVAQRTQEIGVRMALGAARGSVVSLVVGQGMTPAAVGLVAGLGAAAWLSGVLRSMLYDVSPTDPWVFAGTAALLSAVALVAAYLPARRAARVDPLVALRSD